MSNKVGKRLVPALRFPEFRKSEGWAKALLSQIAAPVKGRGRQEEQDHMLTLSVEMGVVSQGDYFGKKIAGDNTDRYVRINHNDFVYNDRATKTFTYGAIKRLSRYKSGLVSPIYKCFRFRASQNPPFWEFYFESGTHEGQLKNLINEGARAGRYNISIDRFLSIPVWSPLSPEQARIGDSLSSVDDLITVQAKKIEALKVHKKGLMQQLFPTAGETVPRLRFSKFQNAGEWKAKKIKNILERVSNPVVVQSSDFYREIGIRSHGKGIFHKEMVSGTQLGDKRVFWVEENTLVLNIVFAWEQAVATVSKEEAGMIASHRFPMFKGINKTSIEFIKHFLLTKKGKFLLGLASPGGAGRNRTLGRKEFENLEFHVPVDLDEQVLIAECLSSLDTLIFAQTQKLATLKNHKKALMQGLFPSMTEAEA